MPIPLELLDAWLGATLVLPEGAPTHPGRLSLAPASTAGRPPTPLGLLPEAWFVSAAQPANRETSPEEDAALNQELLRSLKQAQVAALPARLEGDGLALDGAVLLGVDRTRALKLGYKRKQWAVLGIFRDRVEVVYTGVNSRER